MMPTDEHCRALEQIAREAGTLILQSYGKNRTARPKADRSPVTEADLAAHRYIAGELTRMFPGIPAISEEDENPPAAGHTYFLVDPLDGTRSFAAGEDEFSVNIALMHGEEPVFGVVAAPAFDLIYSGGVTAPALRYHADATAVGIAARPVPGSGLVVTRSRSRPSARADAFLATLPAHEIIPASSAIKLCWVAEGKADVYPRFGRTMEWDTAAGHAIVTAAGGSVLTEEGNTLLYGKPGLENPAFIAWGKRD